MYFHFFLNSSRFKHRQVAEVPLYETYEPACRQVISSYIREYILPEIFRSQQQEGRWLHLLKKPEVNKINRLKIKNTTVWIMHGLVELRFLIIFIRRDTIFQLRMCIELIKIGKENTNYSITKLYTVFFSKLRETRLLLSRSALLCFVWPKITYFCMLARLVIGLHNVVDK